MMWTAVRTPEQQEPPRTALWKRVIAGVLMVTLQVSAFAQARAPLQRLHQRRHAGDGRPGGEQQHHPAAARPDQPQPVDHGRGGAQQHHQPELCARHAGRDGSRHFAERHSHAGSRPGGRPRRPLPQPPLPSPRSIRICPAASSRARRPPTTWRATNQILLDAQAAGYLSTTSGNYLGKTHPSSSDSLTTRGFDVFPDKPVFQAAQDPLGGATVFFAIQGEKAKLHLQALHNQIGGLAGGYTFYSQQRIAGPGAPGGSNYQVGDSWGTAGRRRPSAAAPGCWTPPRGVRPPTTRKSGSSRSTWRPLCLGVPRTLCERDRHSSLGRCSSGVIAGAGVAPQVHGIPDQSIRLDTTYCVGSEL